MKANIPEVEKQEAFRARRFAPDRDSDVQRCGELEDLAGSFRA